MLDYLPQLHQKLVFNKDDLTLLTGSKQRTAALLLNYQARGLIVKIRRNLYCVLNLASSAPEASKVQIACAVTPSATVAYHAAMAYHGFAHQPFYEMSVISDTRFTPFEFDAITYRYFRNPIPFGIQTFDYDHSIRVTDLERTIVDCIDRIDLCGGVEELMHCLSSVRYANVEQLLIFLGSYNKIALFKKAGFILSRFAETLHIPKEFFTRCRSKSDQSITRLTTIEPCTTYSREWHLYVPQHIDNFII